MKLARQFLKIVTYLLLFLTLPSTVFGFGSSSTNYILEGEFGIFGGAKTSTNYRLTDTGGGFAPGFFTTSNYRNCSGFQCTVSEVPTLTFTLSANSVSLGTLSTGSVSTGSHTFTVKTNYGPYNVKVIADGNLRYSSVDIDNVADGTVSAGSEEYGLSTSDSDTGLDFPTDSDCTGSTYEASAVSGSTPKLIARSLGPTQFLNPTTPPAGETTTVCYLASKTGTTPAGQYSQILTFFATGAF